MVDYQQYSNQSYGYQNQQQTQLSDYYYQGQSAPTTNVNQSHQQYQRKPTGLGIYNIPLFTHFNPKNAIVTFLVTGKTGELSIQISPAIPNNAAIGLRGPVPAGTKVYDHNKQVFSSFSTPEVLDFVIFLRSKFKKDLSGYLGMISDTNNIINMIKDHINSTFGNDFFMRLQQGGLATTESCQTLYTTIASFTTKLTELMAQNQALISNSSGANTKVANSDQFSLYRKHSTGDKVWNFTFDPNLNMLHISVMVGKNKDDRIHISLSSSAALQLLQVVESYVNNYTMIQILCKTNLELSRTMASNNILMPEYKDRDNYA